MAHAVTVPKRLRDALAGLAILTVPPLAHAQDAVGSGPRMVGLFGPPQARIDVKAGRGPDDDVVALKRRGSRNGGLAGPARAFSSNVVTLSEKDPGGGTTGTVDVTYEPDFSTITVRESATCLPYHGASCSFEGRFKRVR